ncbi:glyoxalase/bleomycin resistance/extradiol dioxygenase family protein [Ruminococcaceae bacterium OttesenSCG-928-N02]|nr:glyoxalase/bleomycin resistance/extradiol dioxygenase family protein [Ruminococcaceae bacterium OttesenSCG-928-N02]
MVTPYITFAGNCGAALDFYKDVFKTEIKMAMPYGDYMPVNMLKRPDNLYEWVLHAEMDICGTTFQFADEAVEEVTTGNLVKLTTQIETAKDAQEIFDALCKGDAQVTLPPTQTFYSKFHAAVTDMFGVCWNIIALEAPDSLPNMF